MGIDFSIDDKPVRLTGVVGEPEDGKSWTGERFDSREIDGDDLQRIIESHSYEGPIELTIQTVRQQPPLTDEARAINQKSPAWAYSGFMRFRRRVAATMGPTTST